MGTNRASLRRSVRTGLFAAAGLLLVLWKPEPVATEERDIQRYFNPPPFDFTDAFYRENGIRPEAIVQRVGNADRNTDHWVEDDSNTDPTHNDVRIRETTGGFDKDGNLIYYTVNGMIGPEAFTDDAAGLRARMLAEESRAFLFPKTPRNADGSPGPVLLDPAPPNRRQDNVFDTKDEYFCQNTLGLWIVSFVVYTQEAFATERGRRLLDRLARRNGVDLDGTPLLKTVREIEFLERRGLVEIRVNPESGGDGPRWVI